MATQAWQKWSNVPGAAACSRRQLPSLENPSVVATELCASSWHGRLGQALWDQHPALTWAKHPPCLSDSVSDSKQKADMTPCFRSHTCWCGNRRESHNKFEVIYQSLQQPLTNTKKEEEEILGCSVTETWNIFPCLPPLVGQPNTTMVLL